MFDPTRRTFIQQTAAGLALLGASGLVLRSGAQPTQEVNRDKSDRVLIQMASIKQDLIASKGELKKVTPQPYGPFYRPGAPFRGKLSLPGEPGTTFILSGRVWAYDTKRPLPGAVLDFWHVDMQEKYSNGTTDFRNRGRLISSETGQYELESIRPIPYRPNPTGAPISGAAHTSTSSQFVRDINRSSRKFIFRATRKRMTRCTRLKMR